MTTGPAHWSKLAQARALDNQAFVALASPARDLDADYHAWGHSMLVDPWGDVLAEAGDVEQLIVHDINLERMNEIRTNIPISMQRREQFY